MAYYCPEIIKNNCTLFMIFPNPSIPERIDHVLFKSGNILAPSDLCTNQMYAEMYASFDRCELVDREGCTYIPIKWIEKEYSGNLQLVRTCNEIRKQVLCMLAFR